MSRNLENASLFPMKTNKASVATKQKAVAIINRHLWVREWIARRQEKGAFRGILREVKENASGGLAYECVTIQPACRYGLTINLQTGYLQEGGNATWREIGLNTSIFSDREIIQLPRLSVFVYQSK